jgi:hypothetical protein
VGREFTLLFPPRKRRLRYFCGNKRERDHGKRLGKNLRMVIKNRVD